MIKSRLIWINVYSFIEFTELFHKKENQRHSYAGFLKKEFSALEIISRQPHT